MNRDPKSQKGPYRDPVPIIGTPLDTVLSSPRTNFFTSFLFQNLSPRVNLPSTTRRVGCRVGQCELKSKLLSVIVLWDCVRVLMAMTYYVMMEYQL